MKKRILLLTHVLLSFPLLADSQQDKLSITLDATYSSRYIWYGFDAYYSNHSVTELSADIDFFNTGFGLKVTSARGNHSGLEESEWLTYEPYYSNLSFPDSAFQTNYTIGWTYFNFPEKARNSADAQRLFGSFAWPKLLSANLIPGYTLVAYYPSEGDSLIRQDGGFSHIFSLVRPVTLEDFFVEGSSQTFNLLALTVYNDSCGPGGDAVDSDWSHAIFGVSTEFSLSENITFKPALYYMIAMDDSVNKSDEYWASLGFSYTF